MNAAGDDGAVFSKALILGERCDGRHISAEMDGLSVSVALSQTASQVGVVPGSDHPRDCCGCSCSVVVGLRLGLPPTTGPACTAIC
jgi:hypothetical protein